jgi:tellurite resistance protein
MEFEEEAGYALASWARFEGQLTDELTRAITGAFVLIACADGDISVKEIAEFEQTLTDFEAHLPGLDFAQVRRLFTDISGAILSDPATGRDHALAAVKSVRGNPEQVTLVKTAAEIAVAADNRELARETSALDTICAALNVPRRQ